MQGLNSKQCSGRLKCKCSALRVKVQVQCMEVEEDSMLEASKVPVALEPLAFQGLSPKASQASSRNLTTERFRYQGLHSSLSRPHHKAGLSRPFS